MRFPWLDGLLTLAIVVGGCYLWQSARERAHLEPEYERLKLLTGELNPADPTKVYVRAIPTDEPFEYAWRVYFPPKYPFHVRHTYGSASGGQTSDAMHDIVRVRLREIDGQWFLYHRMPFSGGFATLSGPIAETLGDHPERISVEQLGQRETQSFRPDQEFTFIRITLPDDRRDNENAASSSGFGARDAKPAFEISMGPRGARP